MRKPLKDIAEIRSGHTFRGKIPEDTEGNYHVLQIKDVRNKWKIYPKNLPLIRAIDVTYSNFLESNDVVMPARGEHYNAAVFKLDNNSIKQVIPSNQLFILKIKRNQALPGYLCWYLNQNETQEYLKSEIRGTNIPFISKESLSHLMVRLPSIETQKKIVELIECWEREKELTEQLMQNRETMLKGVFQQLMEK